MTTLVEKTIKTDSYHHIDNGGPSISLETEVQYEEKYPEDKFQTTNLKLSTQYYGYPNVSAMISLNGQDEIAILTAFRNAIDEHLTKLKSEH